MYVVSDKLFMLKAEYKWDHIKLCNMAGEPFSEHVPKLSINFKEILLHPHGNSEEKNKVLKPSIMIILYFYYRPP
jgi:hypothetical protein